MNQQAPTTQIRSFWQGRQRWVIPGLLFTILAVGAFLRFYHLGQAGNSSQHQCGN